MIIPRDVEVEPMPSMILSLNEGREFDPPYYDKARDRDLTIAFHEAGHAMLLLIFKTPFISIELDLDIKTPLLGTNPVEYVQLIGQVKTNNERREYKPLGRKKEEDHYPVEVQRRTLEIAAMYAAGHQAELILHGVNPDAYTWKDNHNDYYILSDKLQSVFGHERDIHIVQRYARHLLTKHWAAVTRIANKLYHERKVDRAQALDILKAVADEERLYKGISESPSVATATVKAAAPERASRGKANLPKSGALIRETQECSTLNISHLWNKETNKKRLVRG